MRSLGRRERDHIGWLGCEVELLSEVLTHDSRSVPDEMPDLVKVRLMTCGGNGPPRPVDPEIVLYWRKNVFQHPLNIRRPENRIEQLESPSDKHLTIFRILDEPSRDQSAHERAFLVQSSLVLIEPQVVPWTIP